MRGAIEADPLGRLMVNGKLCVPVSEGLDYLATMVRESGDLPDSGVLRVNGANFVNAGSSAVEELAMTLAKG
ncbi:MAG: methylmalonyl-CoA mutase family protein [Bacteroidales bacterium]